MIRNPTVEVDLYTDKGGSCPLHRKTLIVSTGMFRAEVPSGASTGIYEAHEVRDKGKDYMGKGLSLSEPIGTVVDFPDRCFQGR